MTQGNLATVDDGVARRLLAFEAAVLALVAVGLILANRRGWTSSSGTEVFGFLTGGVCVWLGVKRSVWTWPFGLANNLAFLVLFWSERLYGDALLQVVFFSMGVYGWWNWNRGGADSDAHAAGPVIRRASLREWLLIAAIAPPMTWFLRARLITAGGASPLWDALTTVLSLAAQLLMSRRKLENWLIWMIADLIYVPLYVSRNLPLTAALYAVFFAMCVAGWWQWRSVAVEAIDARLAEPEPPRG